MPDVEALHVSAGGAFDLPIVGESFYRRELRALATRLNAQHTDRFHALLVREPSNPHDPNAIRVLDGAGATLGYLSREDALAYQPALQVVEQSGKALSCVGRIVGGDEVRPNIGVWLDLESPDKTERDLRAALADPKAMANLGVVNRGSSPVRRPPRKPKHRRIGCLGWALIALAVAVFLGWLVGGDQ